MSNETQPLYPWHNEESKHCPNCDAKLGQLAITCHSCGHSEAANPQSFDPFNLAGGNNDPQFDPWKKNYDDWLEPEFTENALYTLKKRYLRKDPKTSEIIETPKQMLIRVAEAVASNEKENSHKWSKIFYDMMAKKEFLPNSPTLMNAGIQGGQLAACFVLPVNDSIIDIFDAIKYAALIHKSGGGTGFSFSRLRPAGSCVNSTGGVASGPISFLKVFNSATEQIKQGGKRRGANMGILRVDHPDIIQFIRAKEKDGDFNNFNLSVAVTNKFMDAVIDNDDYELVDPYTGKTAKQNARDVFNLLVEKAWLNGEPGIIFIDKINAKNPTPKAGEIESTNPCGEQPLLPWEACNLGSINLAKFVNKHTRNMNFKDLQECVRNAVRFLDNVIDISEYPLAAIDEMVKINRKIGLGVMGFADALFMLGIPYNSEEARNLASDIMQIIQKTAFEESQKLAQEKGAFPACKDSIFKDTPVRNATLTTIAPTGTLSILADCSSGIEPVFALAFTRHILEGSTLYEFNPVLLQKIRELGIDNTENCNVILKTGKVKNLDALSPDLKKVFVTASEISPMDHLLMQSAFQEYTDNAVSKTVNLPNEAGIETVMDIYLEAYKTHCKGITVYRDGSRCDQPMRVEKKEPAKPVAENIAENNKDDQMSERPDTLTGFTQKIKTGLGTMYLTINELNGKPFEVFATIGKSGRSTMAKAEAIGRLVSLALRSGIKVENVVRQIKGIGGEHPIFCQHGMLLSIPDAIARTLEARYMQKQDRHEKDDKFVKQQTCPECGGELAYSEGCVMCLQCAWSRCG